MIRKFKKVLVLGSSGQIGKPLVNHLRCNDFVVLEFDIKNGTAQDLRITGNALLEQYIIDCDIIHFLAFDVGGSKYLHTHQDDFDFIKNNVEIMSNTFDLIRKYKKPFIFASSQMTDIRESTYGLLKEVGERYTKSLGGLNVKLWNVYGAEEVSEKSHVIPDFIEKAKTHRKIEMRTDGSEIRQLLHVDDFSDCMLTLTENYDKLDKLKPFHISNFEWVSILDVAKAVASNFEGVTVVPSDKKDAVQFENKTDPDEYILRYWTPKITLDLGIQDIIKKINSV